MIDKETQLTDTITVLSEELINTKHKLLIANNTLKVLRMTRDKCLDKYIELIDNTYQKTK